jgi:cytohesin
LATDFTDFTDRTVKSVKSVAIFTLMSEELFEAIDDGDVETVRELIRGGVDVNVKNGILEEPALLKAAEEDSYEILDALLAAGANPDATDFGGTTALVEAARSAKVDFVERLVWAGADLERADKETGWTALIWAVWWSCQTAGEPIRPNYATTVERLLEAGADPNHASKDRMTPLMYAAALDRSELAELLLDYDADPDAVDEDGRTAESIAASKGNRAVMDLLLARRGAGAAASLVDAVKTGDTARAAELLDAGSDPNDAEGGRPALLWAAELGHAEIVRLLVERGANPNPKTKGETPLAAAVRLRHGEIARTLAAAGADPNVKAGYEGTLLAQVAEWGDVELVRALVAAGAKVNPKGDSWSTPLMMAATYGRAEIVEALVEAGADPKVNKSAALARAAGHGSLAAVRALLAAGVDVKAAGNEAITDAAAAGAREVVEALLAAGADPSAKNEDRESALMIAAQRGHAGVVDALVAAGARLDAKSGTWTPLHFAAERGHAEIARRLVAAGAKPGGKGRLPAAVAAGDAEAVRAAIVAREPVDAPEPGTRWTPLEWALLLGHTEIALALLDAGAAPVSGAGEPLLATAAEYGRDEVVARILSDTKPAPDERALAVALSRAAKAGHTGVVARLVATGMDPDARDDRRGTALMRAAEEGHVDAVRALLHAGADPRQKDGLGMTVRDLAELREHTAIVELVDEHQRRAARAEKRSKPKAKPPARARQDAKALERAVRDGDLATIASLVAGGADPNHADEQGLTLLLQAMRANRPDVVEALLAAGADPNAPPNLPPLIVGVHDPAMREALLAAGADVDVRDLSGQTPLMVACWRKQTEAAMRLLEAGADVAPVDDKGRTALAFACMHEQGPVALALLERGADPEPRDVSNRTALQYAAWAGLGDVAGELLERAAAGARPSPKLDLALAIVRNDAAAVRAAFAAGIAPTATDPFVKWPPLMWAALAGDDETVRRVLEAGADPNVKKDGQTPVRLLWARGRVGAVLDLVAAGADPDSTVEPYSQPLVAVAAQSGDTAVVRALLDAGAKPGSGALYGAATGGHVETVRVLLAAGARPDGKDMVDRTPLLRALQNGHVEVAHLLVDAGAPLDAKADQTPILSWSVLAGRHDALDLLLDAGANPSLKDGDGNTPLHLAVRAGDPVAVARLVAARAAVDVKNRAGRTPLAEAAFLGLPSVVDVLVAARAKGAGAKAAFDLAAREGGGGGDPRACAARPEARRERRSDGARRGARGARRPRPREHRRRVRRRGRPDAGAPEGVPLEAPAGLRGRLRGELRLLPRRSPVSPRGAERDRNGALHDGGERRAGGGRHGSGGLSARRRPRLQPTGRRHVADLGRAAGAGLRRPQLRAAWLAGGRLRDDVRGRRGPDDDDPRRGRADARARALSEELRRGRDPGALAQAPRPDLAPHGGGGPHRPGRARRRLGRPLRRRVPRPAHGEGEVAANCASGDRPTGRRVVRIHSERCDAKVRPGSAR